MTEEKKKRFPFPRDAHDVVALVRFLIQATVFTAFVILPDKISFLGELEQLQGLQFGVSAAVSCSLIFLTATVFRRLRREPLGIIPHFEAIIDAAMIIWLIFVFGGMNGPFFFFYFLGSMEAAFTFNIPVVVATALLGVFSVVGDYLYQIYFAGVLPTTLSVLMVFFRVVAISLISYYGFAFMRSILRERESSRKLHDAYVELQALGRMKDEFLSIASHELRTPMSVIKSYLWMLSSGKYGELDKRQKNYLSRAAEGTERMISLINDMLSVSRLEQGRLKPDLEEVDVVSVGKRAVEELQTKAGEKQLELRFHQSEEVLPKVTADVDWLRQIIDNLLGNAIKYTTAGQVSVGIGFLEKEKRTRLLGRSESKPDRILVTVTDTGRGISKEDIPRLFKKFSRLDFSFVTAAEAGGTGLGLYIVQLLVQKLGGEVGVESELGKGSNFWFTIPVASPSS